MNLAEIMLRGWNSALPYVAVGVGGMILLGSAVHSCNRSRDLQQELLTAQEEVELRKAQVSAFEISNEGLKRDLAEELKSSAVLRATLGDTERRVKEATGKKPKVIEVVRYVTVPGQAGGEAPPGREALVSRGDTLQIRGTSLKLETKAGNHVVTGTAAVWRLAPLPEALIYEGPIDLGKTKAVEEKRDSTPASRRWGAGVVGSIDTKGSYALGPAISYSLWRVDGSLGVTFPDQRAIGSVLVRW